MWPTSFAGTGVSLLRGSNNRPSCLADHHPGSCVQSGVPAMVLKEACDTAMRNDRLTRFTCKYQLKLHHACNTFTKFTPKRLCSNAEVFFPRKP